MPEVIEVDLDEHLVKEMVVASVGKCVTCGRPYDADGVTVLGHQDNLWFLMIVCGGCSSHALVTALLKEGRARPLTDLTDEEFSRFNEERVVTADDVLDMHEYLETFNGDFAVLFGSRGDRRTRDL